MAFIGARSRCPATPSTSAPMPRLAASTSYVPFITSAGYGSYAASSRSRPVRSASSAGSCSGVSW